MDVLLEIGQMYGGVCECVCMCLLSNGRAALLMMMSIPAKKNPHITNNLLKDKLRYRVKEKTYVRMRER